MRRYGWVLCYSDLAMTNIGPLVKDRNLVVFRRMVGALMLWKKVLTLGMWTTLMHLQGGWLLLVRSFVSPSILKCLIELRLPIAGRLCLCV